MKLRKMELSVLLLAVSLIAGTAGAQDITTGLMGHWNFDDGSGVVAKDSSPNNNDGTLVNGPSWVDGPEGCAGALSFNDTDWTYVDCGDFDPASVAGHLTIAFWANFNATGTQGTTLVDTMVAKRDNSTAWMFQLFIHTDNHYIKMHRKAGGVFAWGIFLDGESNEIAMPVDEWTHIAVTTDGTDARIYLNGEYKGIATGYTLGDPDDAPVCIGSVPHGNETFNGMLDEVRLYSRAMTADDISLLMAYTIPGLAQNIAPENGAVSVQVDTNLVWDEPLAFTPSKYDLYYKAGDPNFGTGATLVTDIVHTDPCNVYDPPDFDYETTIYWRVDSYAPGYPSDPCIGSVWNFTTATAKPVITEDPCSLTVAAGDTAVFRVKEVGGVDYTWKRQSDDATVGSNSPVLTLTNVQKDPCEDSYRCIVVNPAGEDISEWAGLWTKRLVARWEFEDDLADSETDGWDGVYTDPNTANEPPVPVFDPSGLEGKALSLAADALHVRITGSEDCFNFYPQGYTINTWVKTEQVGVYGCIASKQYRGESHPTDSKGWVLNCTNTGKAVSSLRQVDAAVSTTDINDNQWHMVTGMYDAEAGVVAVYVDGKLESESAPSSDVAPMNDYPVVLGAETVFAELAVYEGLLDKMSIYSYALSPLDVAVLYTDVMTGESICVEPLERDFDGDCRVNLLDFAVFTTSWLECNLVPSCMP